MLMLVCTTMSRHALRSIFLAALLLTPGAARGISPSTDTVTVGGVTDTIHAASNPTQTYALFLPSRYNTGRRWPLLILMDPRGRALIPLKLFQSAAERYGYIVASSYQTQSDGPIEPNDKAVNAIVTDAQAKFSVDTRRFYFAGFSGTGRLAWYYAYSIPSNTAGIIEVGAGLPDPGLLLREKVAGDSPAPFAVFLIVGSHDFNYEEVRALDAKLRVFAIRDHLETFDGTHNWPPESVCADALTWMQLQAMRDGRLAIDRPWVDSLFGARARRADDLVSVDRYAAFLLYQQLENEFAGIHDIGGMKLAAERFAGSESVKRMVGRLAAFSAAEQSFHEREDSFFSDFAKNSQQGTDRLRAILNLDALRDRAAQTRDTLDAAAASRLLSSVFVRASFYEPRRYLAQGDTVSALRLYALAQSIHPNDAQLCGERDRVFRVFAQTKSVPGELRCESASKTGAPN